VADTTPQKNPVCGSPWTGFLFIKSVNLLTWFFWGCVHRDTVCRFRRGRVPVTGSPVVVFTNANRDALTVTGCRFGDVPCVAVSAWFGVL
jgi:hypothetical protein